MVLLPMAILMPTLFGVDPWFLLLLAGFALATLLSLSGLAVLSSALAATKKAGGSFFVLDHDDDIDWFVAVR